MNAHGWRGWLCDGVLAYLCVYVSSMIRAPHLWTAIEREINVRLGQGYQYLGEYIYFPEFQNRVLFAELYHLLRALGIGDVAGYLGLRLALALALFRVYRALLVHTASVRDAQAGHAAALLLAAVLMLSFNHGIEHSSDFLDPLLMLGLAWAALRDRYLLLLALTLIAAANRESAAFAGVIWYFVRAQPGALVSPRRMVEALILIIAAYLAVLALRYGYGGEAALVRLQTYNLPLIWPKYIAPVLADPKPWSWPMLLAAAVALPLAHATSPIWRQEPGRGLLLAAGCMAAISALWSSIDELRVFAPTLTLLVLAVTVAGKER